MFTWPKIHTIKKVKPLGSTTPYVWVVEPSYGCNLNCAYCCAGLIDDANKDLMTEEIWRAIFSTLNAVSPTVRVDLCGVVGEPILNPYLTEWLPIARKLAPLCQIQITTNGTMLSTERVKYKELLDAGANIIYVDQYADHKIHEALAEESGYPWYQYYNAPEGAWTPWKFYGPHIKVIVLMDPPEAWPKSRLRANLLGNWYGNLNWERAAAFNMKPLIAPLTRRCNQPFTYVNVTTTGDYLLCCQDGLHITVGKFGNIIDGIAGFHKFWYGNEIQTIRRRLREKDRSAITYACAKCNVTFSRCDFRHWTDEEVSKWWDGLNWNRFNNESKVSL